jgi:hypothetical protein
MIIEVSWRISESIPTVLGQPHCGVVYYEVDEMPDKEKVVAHLQTFIRHLDPFSVRIEKTDLTPENLVSRGMAFYRNTL